MRVSKAFDLGKREEEKSLKGKEVIVDKPELIK